MRVPYSSHMSRFIQSALVFAAANLTVVSATIAETLDTHREHSASFEESAVLFLAVGLMILAIYVDCFARGVPIFGAKRKAK